MSGLSALFRDSPQMQKWKAAASTSSLVRATVTQAHMARNYMIGVIATAIILFALSLIPLFQGQGPETTIRGAIVCGSFIVGSPIAGAILHIGGGREARYAIENDKNDTLLETLLSLGKSQELKERS